jgi:RNA polymerase sigma factor (sigma-70 family)
MGRNSKESGISVEERNRLFDKHITPNVKLVYKTVAEYTMNSSDVDDNYQDSLMNLLNYIHTYRPEMSIQTWIITCTVRFVGKLEAAKGLKAPNKDDFWNSYLKKYAPKGKMKMDYIEDSAEAMRVKDDSVHFENQKLSDESELAITSIKPIYARAFLMRHMVGMSLDEIAEIETSEKSIIKHRIHTAKKLLAAKLSPDAGK